MKTEDFTEGQIELLKLMVQGCNIALYRTGEIRLRDNKHNPLKNLRRDMFDKIRNFLIQKDGLFIINPNIIEKLPRSIVSPVVYK